MKKLFDLPRPTVETLKKRIPLGSSFKVLAESILIAEADTPKHLDLAPPKRSQVYGLDQLPDDVVTIQDYALLCGLPVSRIKARIKSGELATAVPYGRKFIDMFLYPPTPKPAPVIYELPESYLTARQYAKIARTTTTQINRQIKAGKISVALKRNRKNYIDINQYPIKSLEQIITEKQQNFKN